MYAVIQTGGKQYQVKEGDHLRIEKVPGVAGQALVFNRVLFLSHDKDIKVGTPLLAGAKVEAEIIKNDRAPKVLVFKKKRRKGYAKKQGHRQHFTEVKILKIHA